MNTQTVTTKICSKCGEEKLLEMFAKKTEGKYGRESRCKECDPTYKPKENKLEYADRMIKRGNRLWESRFDYSLIDFSKENTEVMIVCKKHGQFNADFNLHFSGKYSCPNCAKEKTKNLPSVKLNAQVKKILSEDVMVGYIQKNVGVKITKTHSATEFSDLVSLDNPLETFEKQEAANVKLGVLWKKILELPLTD